MRAECNIGGMADEDGYRLSPLREVRAHAVAASRGGLADAVADAAERERAVAVAAARVDDARQALARASVAGVETALAATWRDRHVARLRGDLERAMAEHSRRVAAHRDGLAVMDDARAEVATARARRELVERHFASWRELRRKVAERRGD
jgi:hypothetical protein